MSSPKLAYFADHRTGFPDLIYSSAKTASAGHVIQEYTPISDQGSIGSCVANACCDALEIVLAHSRQDKSQIPQLSRRFLYWTSRAYDGTLNRDDGTYCRTALRQLNKVGVCAEEECPYDPHAVFEAPSLEATIRASENKVFGYYSIATQGAARLVDIASAVASDHPVVFGTDVGPGFLEYADTGVLRPEYQRLGGHAMIVVGFRVVAGKYQFLVRNSWGSSWKLDGRAWLSEDFFAWSKTRDLWVLTQMNELL